MKIFGFNELSDAGFDFFAPSVFLSGCNLRCPYCMNSRLVTGENLKEVDLKTIDAYIEKERPKTIVISGGEPLTHHYQDIIDLVNHFHSFGCKVSLSTNGMLPENLTYVLCNCKIDYIALDIKSPSSEIYEQISGNKDSYDLLKLSIDILRTEKEMIKDFNYEFRTTVYPKYINKDNIRDIGKIINKDEVWVLQPFRNAKNMLCKEASECAPYSKQEINEIYEIAKQYSDNVKIREV